MLRVAELEIGGGLGLYHRTGSRNDFPFRNRNIVDDVRVVAGHDVLNVAIGSHQIPNDINAINTQAVFNFVNKDDTVVFA